MPTAIHAFSPEEVMAYLDGELAAERALAVSQHVGECRECQGLVAEFRDVSEKLTCWEVEPSSSVVPIAEGTTVKPKMRFWRRPWVAICVSAAVLVILVKTPTIRYPMQSRVMSAPYKRQEENMARASAMRAVIGEVGAVLPATRISNVKSPTDPLIVRTAQLALVSNEFDHIRSEVERIVKAHGGYIGQLQMNMENQTGRTLNVTLKIPAGQLDAVIGELKQLGHISSESQGGEDVTQRSVDLDARLSNLRSTETRLQQLLHDRTGKLADVLEVEEAVDRTRGEIEQAEAERKTLSNQISFASLRFSVSEEYRAKLENHGPSVLTRLHNSAIEGYRDAVDGMISALAFLLSIGPTLLIIAVAGFFPALWFWRRRRSF